MVNKCLLLHDTLKFYIIAHICMLSSCDIGWGAKEKEEQKAAASQPQSSQPQQATAAPSGQSSVTKVTLNLHHMQFRKTYL